jgi:excisionase family DNA binding protein
MPIQVGDLKLYDVEELSDMLHVQDRTIRKLLREGQLKARKLARKWYVSEESLKEYFSQTEPAGQDAKGGE